MQNESFRDRDRETTSARKILYPPPQHYQQQISKPTNSVNILYNFLYFPKKNPTIKKVIKTKSKPAQK